MTGAAIAEFHINYRFIIFVGGYPTELVESPCGLSPSNDRSRSAKRVMMHGEGTTAREGEDRMIDADSSTQVLGRTQVIGCVAVEITRAAAVGTAEQYNEALTGWKRTLEQYVDVEGRVNFLALSSDIADLKHFVEVLAVFGPATQAQAFATRNEVLAYHINAYNALAMYGVIDRGIPDNFNNILKQAWFFRFRDIVIAGQTTNLYDYENKVIRPFNEPRVHFALNCMVRGCPRLPRYPFRGETLELQLKTASREFFNDEEHLRIDDEKKRVYVSSILDFYTEDFVRSGKVADLPAYINLYRKRPIPEGYEVRFIKYDWTVNQQPK
jgi:hypothetical protein